MQLQVNQDDPTGSGEAVLSAHVEAACADFYQRLLKKHHGKDGFYRLQRRRSQKNPEEWIYQVRVWGGLGGHV